MRRRGLLLGAGALAMLGLGWFAVESLLYPEPTPGVSLENYWELKKGMTQKEVAAILGGPGQLWPRAEGDGLSNGKTRRDWKSAEWWITTTFDRHRTLVAFGIHEPGGGLFLPPAPPTFWDRLRRLLRW
jgi:hypothetical protein